VPYKCFSKILHPTFSAPRESLSPQGLVKKITTGGTFRFRSRLMYLANAMVDQHIGLEETDDGPWTIYFNTILLATFDERDYIITG
jgi:hypothetical protein